MITFIGLVGGLLLLFIGGDGLVRGSVTIAEKLNFSILLISTVFIGFGTSAPELIVSLDAALASHPEITLGNVIGSNITNILLVLGTASTIAVIPCKGEAVVRDSIIGVVAALLITMLGYFGNISRISGFVLFVLLIAYLTFTVAREKSKKRTAVTEKKIEEKIEKEAQPKATSIPFALLVTVISIFLLIAGARLLVTSAIVIANYFNVSKTVIGLTVVAVGTSLPELATAIMASYRKHPDAVIGNILGSNLFNLLFILGMTAIIVPIPFTAQLATFDVWLMSLLSIFLAMIIIFRKQITRRDGILSLLLYALYVFGLFMFGHLSN